MNNFNTTQQTPQYGQPMNTNSYGNQQLQQQYDPPYKFKTNIPLKCQLKFDEPKTGEGKFGFWACYKVTNLTNGQEVTFFASDKLHALLIQCRQNDYVEIVKSEVQGNKGNYKQYQVYKLDMNGNRMKQVLPLNQPQYPQQSFPGVNVDQNQNSFHADTPRLQASSNSFGQPQGQATNNNVYSTPNNQYQTVNTGIAGTIQPTQKEKEYYDAWNNAMIQDNKGELISWNKPNWIDVGVKNGMDANRLDQLWQLWIEK